jgi:hypothetical protein
MLQFFWKWWDDDDDDDSTPQEQKKMPTGVLIPVQGQAQLVDVSQQDLASIHRLLDIENDEQQKWCSKKSSDPSPVVWHDSSLFGADLFNGTASLAFQMDFHGPVVAFCDDPEALLDRLEQRPAKRPRRRRSPRLLAMERSRNP